MVYQITVLYFAAARDITQRSSETFTVDSDWTLARLTRKLIDVYGSPLERILGTSMYAVNMEYISSSDVSTTSLKANDEIAIIPPVSGG
ncbi:hypothetical protein CLU79DRAFT_890559 [Phycomyces nitens]|nr:hypothetical protein CLU79DRAFT_890559 [Phycomyces nitens]